VIFEISYSAFVFWIELEADLVDSEEQEWSEKASVNKHKTK
jgi:hypothetical protein